MGAVPKRKISKGRKNRRRANDGLKEPAVSVCPKCKKPKRPHFKCENCGFYGPEEKKSSAKGKARTEPKKTGKKK